MSDLNKLNYCLERIEACYPEHLELVQYYLNIFNDVVRFGVSKDIEEVSSKLQSYYHKLSALEIIEKVQTLKGSTDPMPASKGIEMHSQGGVIVGEISSLIMSSPLDVVKILGEHGIVLEDVAALEVENAKKRGQMLAVHPFSMADISGFHEFKSCLQIANINSEKLGMNSSVYNIMNKISFAYKELQEFLRTDDLSKLQTFEGYLAELKLLSSDLQTTKDFFDKVVYYQSSICSYTEFERRLKEVYISKASCELRNAYNLDGDALTHIRKMEALLTKAHGTLSYLGLPISEIEVYTLKERIISLASE